MSHLLLFPTPWWIFFIFRSRSTLSADAEEMVDASMEICEDIIQYFTHAVFQSRLLYLFSSLCFWSIFISFLCIISPPPSPVHSGLSLTSNPGCRAGVILCLAASQILPPSPCLGYRPSHACCSSSWHRISCLVCSGFRAAKLSNHDAN